MGTSFAPSPIARVMGLPLTFSRTSATISAFCFGLTRQAMSTEHCVAISSNFFFFPGTERISLSALPVTIIARSSNFRTAFKSLSCLSRSMTPSSSSTMAIFMLGVSTFVLNPMFLAVSNLSPVNTHNLIPALRTFSIASPTPTCNLSSIAVAPRISKFFSMSAATAASSSSRPLVNFCASSYFFWKSLTSTWVNFLYPMTKVRRPCKENSLRCSTNSRCDCDAFSAARSNMMLSAPLTNNKYSGVAPTFFSTTTDMRFRVELNALVASTLYWIFTGDFEGSEGAFAGSECSTISSLPLRSTNFHPRSAAAETRANSSGLSAS
mmetsp:Transcript_77480/g.224814  ORF Transcript_77480/g.224814 Transcript_77480/m.224814 type:complete len:323 (-) Transcript_77480:1555-2523(-)